VSLNFLENISGIKLNQWNSSWYWQRDF